MEKSKKKMISQALICAGLLCVIWGGYALLMKGINRRVNKIVKDDFSWVSQIDEIKCENGEVYLEGFAFELGKNAYSEKFEIVLYNLDTGKYVFSKMKYYDREEINQYFLCEYDYTSSGFVASIKERKLELEKNDYEVLLRPIGEKYAFSTGTYLADGVLVYTNPKKFVALEVEGTDLEPIVNEGVLRVYEPQNHIYVYQYGGELYWIAEKEYNFVEDDTIIRYTMNTTQIEKLSTDREAEDKPWSELSFYFTSNELKNWNTGKYRVTKKALPVAYSVTKIWTGNWFSDTGWLWRVEFRPWYEFDSMTKMEKED